MTSLERVVDGVNNASGVQRARLELRKEALHDLVAFYSDLPDQDAPAKAPGYFEKIARTPDAIAAEYAQARAKRLATLAAKHAPVPDEESDDYQVSERDDLLLRLAQLYRDQGKHLNALTVAGALLERLAGHPRSVALYRLRAESSEKLRRRDQVVTELERLAAIASAIDLIAATSSGCRRPAFIRSLTTSSNRRSRRSHASQRIEAGITGKPSRFPDASSSRPTRSSSLKVGFDTLQRLRARSCTASG